MSEKPEKKEKSEPEEEVEEEETTTTVTTTKKGLLGFNFNDPIVLMATVLGVSVVAALSWNFIRGFLGAKPAAPPQQKPVDVTVTPEQMRQAQYQRDLEMASRNLFATNMNNIEATNKELKNDGVHFYDQYFNQYERKPATSTTFEDDIEIVDDNNDTILTVNQKQTYYKPAPPTVQLNKPTFNTKPAPQPQKIESQEVINDDEIEMITNEPQIDKIPKEFVNVGNSETEFDRIESKEPQQPQRKQQKEVDFENLEMDANVLEQYAASAYTNDYY